MAMNFEQRALFFNDRKGVDALAIPLNGPLRAHRVAVVVGVVFTNVHRRQQKLFHPEVEVGVPEGDKRA
eukprot:3661194-Prorocentrum_lima.AAC.1